MVEEGEFCGWWEFWGGDFDGDEELLWVMGVVSLSLVGCYLGGE